MPLSSFSTIQRILRIYAFARRSSTLSIFRQGNHSSLNGLLMSRSLPTVPFLGSLFTKSSSSPSSREMSYPVQKSDDEWRAVLNREQFHILREKGTEKPYTPGYDVIPSAGTYNCAACDAPLYTANHKFKSSCGWPAFFDAVPGAVTRHVDHSLGVTRTEIVCSRCGGHLGHVFKGEGYATPTDERHCVNSISLRFKDDAAEMGTAKAEE